jgi:hypothetical protein
MSKFYDKKVILQKIEATEGTDAAPVVGTDAILTRNYNPNRSGNGPARAEHRSPVFRREARHPGPAAARRDLRNRNGWRRNRNDRPAVDEGQPHRGLRRGRGGRLSVVQTPISTSHPVRDSLAYIDNLLVQTIGARATMGIRVTDDEIPVLHLYRPGPRADDAGIEAVPGTPTVTAFQTPLLASTENTTFTLDGFALPLRSLELDANIDLNYRSLIGPPTASLAQPGLGRSHHGELPDLTSEGLLRKIRPGTTMALSLVHGTTRREHRHHRRAEGPDCRHGRRRKTESLMVQWTSSCSRMSGNDEITVPDQLDLPFRNGTRHRRAFHCGRPFFLCST